MQLKSITVWSLFLMVVPLLGSDLCDGDLECLHKSGITDQPLPQGLKKVGLDLPPAADLSYADFTHADLRGANLLEAQLKGALLQNANFEETDLMWANLQGANLENTKLDGAYLHGTDLRETCITQEQIKLAYLDEDTQLPKGIIRPS